MATKNLCGIEVQSRVEQGTSKNTNYVDFVAIIIAAKGKVPAGPLTMSASAFNGLSSTFEVVSEFPAEMQEKAMTKAITASFPKLAEVIKTENINVLEFYQELKNFWAEVLATDYDSPTKSLSHLMASLGLDSEKDSELYDTFGEPVVKAAREAVVKAEKANGRNSEGRVIMVSKKKAA